jgi:uncharacterized protein (DUF58 family)
VEHGNITFHALRDYVVGDDLRRIHWKSSARIGSLMVREHVDTSLPRITLLLDTRAELHDVDSFEFAVEAAASVVVSASRSGYPVSLVTTCGRSAAGRGFGADAAPLLDLLSGVVLVPSSDLGPTLRRLSQGRRGESLVVITGKTTTDDMLPVFSLARRFADTALALVCDGSDECTVSAPPSVSVIRANDGEEFARRWNQAFAR